jgi:NADH-quinone oxidoreductase subunit M
MIFFLLFYGLAVRIPLFPLQGWLPRIAEHGSVAVAPVLLIGLKTGIYGIFRFVLPLLPEAVMQWHLYVIAFAVAGVFYAALLALTQINLRRLLAFAVISHSGILVIGLFSLSELAFQGALILSINFGLAGAGLLFMTGMVFRRTRTALLHQLGGLFETIPLIGITFFVAGLSIVGMPGTPGFDAAHLILEASMHRYGALVTIAAALGNVVAAGFLLWAFQRAFLSARPEGMREIEPVNRAEVLLAGIVLVCLLGAGFYSEPLLELVDMSLVNLGELYAHAH